MYVTERNDEANEVLDKKNKRENWSLKTEQYEITKCKRFEEAKSFEKTKQTCFASKSIYELNQLKLEDSRRPERGFGKF